MISRRSALALVVSAVLLALVLWVADIGTVDLSTIRPVLLLPAVAAYVAVLALRGAQLRLLAPALGTAADTVKGTDRSSGGWRWVALAGRHQLVFILSPSGAGDLAFPLLAKRMVGLGTVPAAALIAGARLRDICAVLGLGCAGLAGTGHVPLLAGTGAAVCCAALYFSDVTVALAGRLLRRLRKVPPPEPAQFAPNRLPAALLTLLIWLTASGGIMAGFAAAGHPLGPFEAWVMLAGLNVAGALALSLAGLGVAEAGAAGVLVFLGMPLAEAAALAIVARPLLLLSNAAASGVIEAVTRLTGRALA